MNGAHARIGTCSPDGYPMIRGYFFVTGLIRGASRGAGKNLRKTLSARDRVDPRNFLTLQQIARLLSSRFGAMVKKDRR